MAAKDAVPRRPEGRRRALLEGWDEPTMILDTHRAAFAAFEARQRQCRPWLWSNDNG